LGTTHSTQHTAATSSHTGFFSSLAAGHPPSRHSGAYVGPILGLSQILFLLCYISPVFCL